MEYINMSRNRLKIKFNDRDGVVIRFSGVRYPDEIIRHSLITLQNSGFGICKLTKPIVMRVGEGDIDVAFIIAKRSDIIDKERQLFIDWANNFPKYKWLRDYLK